ncbi:Cof-type HAD-IIB family hydrolase [Companilactobacillus ginsenosidimutans]|uniref:Haloacid dehalogenase n=1 Tax=Companilactobacillus ginsenosidimutans TaxID=1007676 RepID=A0A0H4R3A4_9LACO|nr:Cof-type HAD-IIB family hydrolase [Companilactobacillus ginsenosidimutans]AKP68255.1 haloacid dehalogenase [Companilactobacillus ginsenosidimutans]
MIKIIASDMDGTLLNDEMMISQNNIDTINNATANGIDFLIASGRQLDEAKPFLMNKFHPGYITLNGAEVYNKDEQLVSSNPISTKSVKQITDYLRENNLYFELITDKGVFSNSLAKRTTSIAELLNILNPTTTYDKALADTKEILKHAKTIYVDNYDEILNNPDTKVMKLLAFDKRQQEVFKPLREDLKSIDDIVITSSSPNNIEINSINAQKGIALMEYAKQKGVKPEEVMAIGDNLNDLSMIKAAGIGVAMKNAVPKIAEVADEQTDSNVNDGVAKIINKVIKNNKAVGNRQ